jgi:hypothetical protein
LRIISNKYLHNNTSSISGSERAADFTKKNDLEKLIWDMNLHLFDFYCPTDCHDDQKLSQYRSKILRDYGIYKQYYNKLKDLFIFYKNLKNKYPFFVDEQIENMI